MSNKKRPPKKKQASGAGSLVVPIVVGAIVLAIIVGAILSVEKQRSLAGAATPTISVPIVTTAPRATVRIPNPEVPRISVKEAKKELDAGRAILVDVRDKAAYDKDHAAGAISMPESDIDAGTAVPPRDKRLILYCT